MFFYANMIFSQVNNRKIEYLQRLVNIAASYAEKKEYNIAIERLKIAKNIINQAESDSLNFHIPENLRLSYDSLDLVLIEYRDNNRDNSSEKINNKNKKEKQVPNKLSQEYQNIDKNKNKIDTVDTVENKELTYKSNSRLLVDSLKLKLAMMQSKRNNKFLDTVAYYKQIIDTLNIKLAKQDTVIFEKEFELNKSAYDQFKLVSELDSISNDLIFLKNISDSKQERINITKSKLILLCKNLNIIKKDDDQDFEIETLIDKIALYINSLKQTLEN